MGKSSEAALRITRRKFLVQTTAAGAVVATRPWIRSAWGITNETRARPNLVLILTDDQRADSLSCAGNRVLRTPNIDSLASRGVRFTNSFTTTAICMTSRASILTGLYARCHGINDFTRPLAPELFAQSYPMLLRQAGYRTGFVGKWGLGGELPVKNYDYFSGYARQGFYFQPGNPKHLTVRQGDQAVEFLRGCSREQPFCLAVSFKAPHVQDEGRNKPGIYAKYPYDRALEPMYADADVPPCNVTDVTPPPAFLNRTLNRTREGPDFSPEHYQETMRDLYRLITGVDMAVARIVATLRERGLADNTVIVFSSDHGSFYGEHGFGGKWLMYEPAIRTPLIVCDPRLPVSRRGTVRHEMVLNLDIPATLLALAGAEGSPGMQGRSLLPLVRGEKVPWRNEMFYEHLFRDGPAGPDSPIAASEGIRTERWKYIRYIDQVPVREQIFDLRDDPREERDLAGEARFSGVLAGMRQRRLDWLNGLRGWRAARRWKEPWATAEARI